MTVIINGTSGVSTPSLTSTGAISGTNVSAQTVTFVDNRPVQTWPILEAK